MYVYIPPSPILIIFYILGLRVFRYREEGEGVWGGDLELKRGFRGLFCPAN